MNKAFIMKLAWGLLQEKSLWVKFLKNKYMHSNREGNHPVATARDSVLWKSICQEWNIVHQNVRWSLGNGRRILFWKDSWLESYGPLVNHVNSEDQIETLNYTMAKMVDNRGNWKWELFAQFLPIQVVMGIVSYIPPIQDVGPDSMVWDQSTDGKFTVSKGYMVQEEGVDLD